MTHEMSTVNEALDAILREGPIPIEDWGCDHHTTLLYAETRAVDYDGRLDRNQMRESIQYPTRLKPPPGATERLLRGHTDYDCLRDAEAVGFGTLSEDESTFDFTDAGFAFVWGLRRQRAKRGIAKREVQRRDGVESARARRMNERRNIG